VADSPGKDSGGQVSGNRRSCSGPEKKRIWVIKDFKDPRLELGLAVMGKFEEET